MNPIQYGNVRKMIARIPMLHIIECVVYQKLLGVLSHYVTQFAKYFATNFKWNGSLIEMPNIFIARSLRYRTLVSLETMSRSGLLANKCDLSTALRHESNVSMLTWMVDKHLDTSN